MSFQKIGSPQPFKVVSDICEECGKNKAQFHVNGKFVCEECKNKLTNKENV